MGRADIENIGTQIPKPPSLISRPGSIPTIRSWLILLIAAIVIPLVGISTAAIWREHVADSARLDAQLQMQASGLAMSVDREIAGAASILYTLIGSTSLKRGDLDSFRSEMDAALARLPGSAIGLSGPGGNQLLLTLLPPGRLMEKGIPANPAFRNAMISGRMEITDLVVGAVSRQPQVFIAIPTPSLAALGGIGALGISMPYAAFATVLAEQNLPNSWVAVLVDRQNKVVSRSIDADRFVGQMSPAAFIEARSRAPEGVIRINRLDGVPAVVAFAAVPVNGYAVAVAVPRADFMAPLYWSLIEFSAVCVVIVLCSIGLAVLLGRRLAHSLTDILTPSGSGPRVPRFREVEAIAQRLAATEQWRGVLMHEMSHRVRNTMMTVQSLAAQTLRSSNNDPVRFQREFTARLMTLARAHNLLFSTGWKIVEIDAVIGTALEPWLAASEPLIELHSKTAFRVGPHQAQVLILALHELATNAAKHGALSCRDGRVVVDVGVLGSGRASIVWRETGGPTPEPRPQRRGFGSTLLERVLPRDLGPGAEVNLAFEADGLIATIVFTPVAEDLELPVLVSANMASLEHHPTNRNHAIA